MHRPLILFSVVVGAAAVVCWSIQGTSLHYWCLLAIAAFAFFLAFDPSASLPSGASNHSSGDAFDAFFLDDLFDD